MPSQDQLDDLYIASLDMAATLLEKNGEFFPIGHKLGKDGQIAAIAVLEDDDNPPSQQVIEGLETALRSLAGAGDIAASAIAVDIRVRPVPDAEPTDAVQVRVRAADYARDVIVPYHVATSGLFRKKRKVSIGTPYAQAAENDIFG
ncbi:hypothetical protein [Erythrobacter alti]|uniref:hypothetical protein n=1 Tax=Erythrobacter alti TaxID=1896145 RepID=UPI0030F3AFE1